MKQQTSTQGRATCSAGCAGIGGSIGLMLFSLAGPVIPAPVQISSSPLYVGGFVPGNLMLVPSVEWPTIDSAANINAFVVTQRYIGYFDPDLCYEYNVDANNPGNEHFYPVAKTTNYKCQAKQWSGNFMNWAATQTIDPFRFALTGGYRVKDTVEETWLEKARHDGSGSFADRTVTPSNVSPYAWANMKIRINGLGSRMRFTETGDFSSGTSAYDDASNANGAKVYEVHVRVKVCDKDFDTYLRQEHCKKYGSNWKPEGLIQQYSDSLRYAIFGYLNDSSDNPQRDGGVMRARAKFVGQHAIDPISQEKIDNSAKEWDLSTGVLIENPDASTLSGTSTSYFNGNSGVINYLNKFGQMTTGSHKSFDPVSELYYAMLRYLKNQGNVSAYTNLSGDDANKLKLADGFPVITSWDDPIQYWCQKNVALGIGDVNTHRDKNLPGNKAAVDGKESTVPSEVTSDSTVDVDKSTNKVFALEGMSDAKVAEFTGRGNSAYIAGLAYDAHTVDLRPEQDVTDSALLRRIKGKQTLSTYWVDVRENTTLANKEKNQYWLAAKYGGFQLPSGFDPYGTNTTSIPESSWYTSGEILDNSNKDKRPDNFFVASDATKMVESLTKAFARIAAERSSSSAPLVASNTQMVTGAAIFQTRYSSSDWSGDLTAYELDPVTQKPNPTPLWSASVKVPLPANRKIYFGKSGVLTEFKSDNISSLDTILIDYLRGDRSKEQPAGNYRSRGGVLGDMVNSTPLYVGKPHPGLYRSDSSYATFVASNNSRTPVVYVGGNDGMLHSFNATSGEEGFAFVPAAVFSSLNEYSKPDYKHRYFVDGEMTVADVKLDGQWKTVLVGSLGRGGRSLFALDVTNPANVKLLWEKDATSIQALGQVIGKPMVTRMGDGDWRVVLGNGFNSNADSARLLMLDLKDGDSTVIDTGTGSGLSAVDVWDTNADGYHDTAYAGDQAGNIWVFEKLNTNSPSKRLLFTAKDASNNVQPVTAAPIAAIDPKTKKRWVFFGTGRFLGEYDLSSKSVQSWYGVIDEKILVNGRSQLVERKIKKDMLVDGKLLRIIASPVENDMSGKAGWFMDLKGSGVTAEGERMVAPNQLRGASLIGTTRIPDASDPCMPEGRGFIMAISPFSGSALPGGFFDVNGDGKVDELDQVNGDYVSGIGEDSSPSAPIFVGNSLLTSLENTMIGQVGSLGGSGVAIRMSWREIIGE